MSITTRDALLPLVHTFNGVFEWSLDIAAELASDYPDVVDAVERVRGYLHARLAGRRAVLAVDDALLTFAILLGALERELGRPGRASATEHWLESIRRRQLAKP